VLTCTIDDGRLLLPRRAPPRHRLAARPKVGGTLTTVLWADPLEETFTPFVFADGSRGPGRDQEDDHGPAPSPPVGNI